MNIAVTHLATTVASAIAVHRNAIATDEASFDDNGVPLSKELADATGAAEVAAYLVMASAPCVTAEDVQLKLDYILNGSVGIRATLAWCLEDDDYGGPATLQAFLQSLVLAAPEPEALTP